MPSPDIEPGSGGVPTYYASYKLLMISGTLFNLGSLFYLIGTTMDFQNGGGSAGGRAFLVLGGLSFMVLGVVDYCNTKLKLHIGMVFAGLFAAIGEMVGDQNRTAAVWLVWLASHLFMLESLSWIFKHCAVGTKLATNDSRKRSLFVAELGDFCFFLGAFMDVCIGYYYVAHLKDGPARVAAAQEKVTKSGADIASSLFWQVSAIIAMTLNCRLGKQGFAGAAGSGGGTSKLSTNTVGSMA